MIPPEKSPFKGLFFVLPVRDDSDEAQLMLRTIIPGICHLYSREEQELRALLSSSSSLFTLRLRDEDTIHGTVSFPRFELLIEALKRTLLDGAESARTDQQIIREYTPYSVAFLNACRFLPTEVGSYVARIQLPDNHPMGDENLLEAEPLLSASVGQRVFDILSLAVNRVMSFSDEIYDDDSLMEVAPLLNVQVLEGLRDIIKEGAREDLTVSLSDLASRSEVRIKRGALLRLARLDQFISFLRDRADTNIPIDIRGRIVRLHSRNPLKNRNYIAVEIIFEGQPVLLGMTLRSADYAVALSAHRGNQEVRVVGLAQRLKRQLSLLSLSILEPQ